MAEKEAKQNETINMHETYMREAISEARKAYELGEVPIGCVIVYQDKIIGRGHNRRKTDQNTLSHAELNAIAMASKELGDWRLEECTLYVTLEPCPMCMGASLNARVDKIYFGAYEQKGRSLTNELAEANLLNHKTEVVGGVLQEECSSLLTDFFVCMRKRAKEEKERAAALENSLAEESEEKV